MATTRERADMLKRQSMKSRPVNGRKNIGGVRRVGSQTVRVDRVVRDNIK